MTGDHIAEDERRSIADAISIAVRYRRTAENFRRIGMLDDARDLEEMADDNVLRARRELARSTSR